MIRLIKINKISEFETSYQFETDMVFKDFLLLFDNRCKEIVSKTFVIAQSVSESVGNGWYDKGKNETPSEYVSRLAKRGSVSKSSTYDKAHPITIDLGNGKKETGIIRISDHRVDLGTWAKNNAHNFGISFVFEDENRKYPDIEYDGKRIITVWEYIITGRDKNKLSLLRSIASSILDLEGIGKNPKQDWSPDNAYGGIKPKKVTNETQIIMKKRDIERMIKEAILEHTGTVTFKKGELRLREDLNNTDSIYVKPSEDPSNQSSMSTDIQQAVQNNPSEKDYTVEPAQYDTSSMNNDVTFDVNAKNGVDAARQINAKMQNPNMRSLGANGQLQANIHITDSKKVKNAERLKKLEEGIHFKKAELDEFLKSIG